MNDNKSDGAVVVEVQPERSRAVRADGEGKGESVTARDSSPATVKESASMKESTSVKASPLAATVANPTDDGDGGAEAERGKASRAGADGGAQAGKEKAARAAADDGAPGAKAKAAGADAAEQSLGTFLIAAREGRGLSADDVVRETRLPPHYLRMMETNDYSEISDQLYLVPFLRRYASFLELDQEDVAMRFVREVQRADGNPGPARLDQPLVAESRQHRGWTGAIVVVGLLAIAAGVYVYESNRHRQVGTDTMMPHASAGVATGAAQ